jgi:hypothetical protein
MSVFAIFHEYFCNVSWIFLQSCVMSISAMCHEYFCNVLWVFLQCVMNIFCNMSWVFLQYGKIMSWVFLQYVMSIFAICHEYFCNVSWIFLQCVMNISAMCHVYFPCYRLWMWSNQRSCYSTVQLSTNNPQQVII